MGSFGVVYKAIHKETGLIYACKEMSIKVLQDKGCEEDLYNEINNLRLVNH